MVYGYFLAYVEPYMAWYDDNIILEYIFFDIYLIIFFIINQILMVGK